MGRFQILIMVGILFGGCRAVIIEPNSDIDIHPHIYTSNIEVVYIPRLVRPPTLMPLTMYHRYYINPPIIRRRPYYRPVPRRYFNDKKSFSDASIFDTRRKSYRSVSQYSRKGTVGDSRKQSALRSPTTAIGGTGRFRNRLRIRARKKR